MPYREPEYGNSEPQPTKKQLQIAWLEFRIGLVSNGIFLAGLLQNENAQLKAILELDTLKQKLSELKNPR